MTPWAQAVLDLPPGSGAEEFWAAALGWPLGPAWADHPELRSFEPPDGDAYVHCQRVDGPAGVHLDLEVEEMAAATERLTGLGATVVRVTTDWTTLTSPGGLDFCVVAGRDHRRPAATRWPGGTRSRLVQVCIDSPADRHEQEAGFWREVTGWRWAGGSSPEFAGKLFPPSGSSLQLLLHRLGDDDGGLVTRAHVDLGADDLEGEAARLVALGARRQWSGDGWITLRDPADLLFCVTENSPDAP